MVLTRRCSVCRTVKDRSAFHKGREREGGLDYHCKECKKAQYRQNAAAIKARAKERYWADRETHIERVKARYERDPKAISAKVYAWKKAHPEQRKANDDRRRCRRVSAPVNDLSAMDWRALVEEWEGRCAYCGATDKPLTRDHVVPLSRGGSHTKSNVVPACGTCNSSKGTRTAEEFLVERGVNV